MINAIGNGASMTPMMTPVQRPDPKTAASTLVANLDTANKGYLEVADLQTAFTQTGADATTAVQDAAEVFSAFDSNGDGRATTDEITSTLQALKDSNQFLQSSDAGTGAGANQAVGAPAGGPPPPPPPPQSGTTATTSFDPADTNGDGIVSAAEAAAATLTTTATTTSTAATNTTTTTTTAATNTTTTAATTATTNTQSAENGNGGTGTDALQRRIARLMDAYGLTAAAPQSRSGLTAAYSSGLSVMA